MASLPRRRFLTTSAASLAAITAAGAADKPNERVRLADMGVRGRGRDLIRGFSELADVDVVTLCEVDENVVPAALKAVAGRQKQAPRVEKDIRRVLQDKNVTALAIAAP
ncbi:MAG TPA: gfo/Idh/MocA family oxidoreductase, partial [Gemmataceae bacterium]|nr:gfo/Idh/MocA family oxidoreductase [Gemmataceae bacterium]